MLFVQGYLHLFLSTFSIYLSALFPNISFESSLLPCRRFSESGFRFGRILEQIVSTFLFNIIPILMTNVKNLPQPYIQYHQI